jgi:membrane fusion protein, multidrug efflux system
MQPNTPPRPVRLFRRRRESVGCLLVVVAASCGSGESGPAVGDAAPGGPGGGQRAQASAPVETAAAERGSIARRVTVSGVVEPIRTVGVNSQLAGALLAVNAEEGTRVGAGAVLARMDDRELRAQVAGALTSLQVASAAFERSEQLLERQVITPAEWDRDRAAHAAAQAQLDQLRTRLDFTTIRSPLAGVVTEKLVERGDVVGSQARLFTVADISTLVVRVPVSEMDVGRLTAGSPVEVMLDAFPGQRTDGVIRRIFPAADPSTRLVPVEIALGSAGSRVAKPGFLARVTLPLGTAVEAIMVPVSAVTGDGGDEAVFVVQEGRAVRKPVTSGLVSGGRVQIVSGLEEGEIVVTVGTNGLRDGAAVRVVGNVSAGPHHPTSGGGSGEGGGSPVRPVVGGQEAVTPAPPHSAARAGARS